MSRRLPLARATVVVGLTLDGKWGWFCKACGSESRYTYGSQQRSRELANRHAVTCKAVQP